jgi:hypothetical protein
LSIADDTPRAAKGLVNITLTGGRVTGGFREALFLAASKAGQSVNEFVLEAAGEKLARAGASFPGVFCLQQDRDTLRPNPFGEGGDHQVALELHGYVPDRYRVAFRKAASGGQLFDYAVRCMKADVERRA